MSIPKRFRDRTLDGYSPETPTQHQARAAARKMTLGLFHSLALIGRPGVGKTHLAAAIANAIGGAEWFTVPELVGELQNEIGKEEGDDRLWTRDFRRAKSDPRLLVLDDLGREKVSEWTGQQIYALVNARYERALPTVITSNLSAAELDAAGYWPVVSRMAEDGALIKVEGPDHRLKAA